MGKIEKIPTHYKKGAVTPYGKKWGDGKEMAKKVFDYLKPATQEIVAREKLDKWPEDCVYQKDRHCSYLPKDWHCATKMTINGRLLDCWIGPVGSQNQETGERKKIYHKVDLEKHLGRKVEMNERGPKPRTLTKDLIDKGFDEESYLERTDVCAEVEYINDRCNALHGVQVKDALVNKKFKHTHNKMKNYSVSDLRYDTGMKRLKVVKEKPTGEVPECVRHAVPKKGKPKERRSDKAEDKADEAGAKPKAKASKLAKSLVAKRKANGTAASSGSASSNSSNGSAASAASCVAPAPSSSSNTSSGASSNGIKRSCPSTSTSTSMHDFGKTEKKRRTTKDSGKGDSSAATPTPMVSAAKTPTISAAKRLPATPMKAPMTPALPPLLPRAPGTPGGFQAESTDQLQVLQEVYKNCLLPFKTKASTTIEDEMHIATIMGVAYMHQFDDSLMVSFPGVLRKNPALRSSFHDSIVDHLEAEFQNRGVEAADQDANKQTRKGKKAA